MSEVTIQVENLVKEYAGVTAVNEVSFTVNRGEIVGFLGPNGAGKSTTMRILTGFVPATSGKAVICGHCVATEPHAVRRCIGYMPENNPLPNDLRVGEYLKLRARLKGVPRGRLRSRLDEALELCDLTRASRRIIGALSKGYRQRVGIADAIISEPRVIIMDEPTIGLDPHQIVLIRDLIGSFRGKMSIILSSHILPEIEITCDRVIIINSGRIVAAASPAELRREFIDRTSYRVEARGDISRLAEVARSIDKKLTIESESRADADGFCAAVIAAPGKNDYGERLLDALAGDSSLRVRALHRVEPTLEEVFMAATRRSWEILMPEGADSNGGGNGRAGGNGDHGNIFENRRDPKAKPLENA